MSKTNDILVPAHAGIILEGEILPSGWVEPEGPFGEFSGYQGEVKWNPMVRFNCITLRKKGYLLYSWYTVEKCLACSAQHRSFSIKSTD